MNFSSAEKRRKKYNVNILILILTQIFFFFIILFHCYHRLSAKEWFQCDNLNSSLCSEMIG
jgi:hypothetical protein